MTCSRIHEILRNLPKKPIRTNKGFSETAGYKINKQNKKETNKKTRLYFYNLTMNSPKMKLENNL